MFVKICLIFLLLGLPVLAGRPDLVTLARVSQYKLMRSFHYYGVQPVRHPLIQQLEDAEDMDQIMMSEADEDIFVGEVFDSGPHTEQLSVGGINPRRYRRLNEQQNEDFKPVALSTSMPEPVRNQEAIDQKPVVPQVRPIIKGPRRGGEPLPEFVCEGGGE